MDKSTHFDVNGQTLPLSKVKSGFTQIKNELLLDEQLSFKARGVLALLLSRPKDWKIYLDEISSRSEKDGKRAVQTAFKELSSKGYLKLTRVYDYELKRFGGTCYQLNAALFSTRQPHFETVCFSDRLESRPTENQTTTKADRHKTASHSNKENSNTKNRNTNQQQQQLVDADEIKENINNFFEDLQADRDWKNSFEEKSIPNFEESVNFLLLHFRQTSLQSGESYLDISAVKKHFRNWFLVNLKKSNLSNFIQIQKTAHRKTRQSILELIPKTDLVFETLKTRKCKSYQQVLEFQNKLIQHRNFYAKNKSGFYSDEERNALKILLSDLDKLINQIERGKAAKRLNWYCQS